MDEVKNHLRDRIFRLFLSNEYLNRRGSDLTGLSNKVLFML